MPASTELDEAGRNVSVGGNTPTGSQDHVLEALGGVKEDVRFTEAMRPRTGEEVPVCQRCEASYGRDAFPPGTQFKSDK
jgi:hypothetical protein